MPTYDFILLACNNLTFNYIIGDGIFDKMNNKDVVNIAWDAARKSFR